LNIGYSIIEDYINFNIFPAQLCLNIRKYRPTGNPYGNFQGYFYPVAGNPLNNSEGLPSLFYGNDVLRQITLAKLAVLDYI